MNTCTAMMMIMTMVVVTMVTGLHHHHHLPPSLPDNLHPDACPTSYHNKHPLVLVSVDGFRAEYLSRGLTPTLQELGDKGVRAPYMKPSYPTITFPNHYTLVTGLYPPAHGIIANKFYDPQFQKKFRIGRPESFKARWWGGEPIWKTIEKQGKLSATFFWPGSEVEGNRPTHWYYYNESIPFTHRVKQVLSWLELPVERRPSFITLYMHDPDSTGHDFGPNSPELEKKLIEVDQMIGQLVLGLKQRSLLSCVNLVVVADHGMAPAGPNRIINLQNYIPDIENNTRFWDGAFARFEPNDGKLTTKYKMMKALACQRPEMRVYARETLPIRWHMGRQRRVEGVVVDVDAGYSVSGDNSFKADMGEHGYDNYFPKMNALFVAHGPDLKRKFEVEAFQNIELYNLMCDLVGVDPAPNNGTWGALHHLLAKPPLPPPPPATPTEEPMVARVPSAMEVEVNTRAAGCQGDGQDNQALLKALRTAQDDSNLLPLHLPWGLVDTMDNASLVLLVHPDTVTAYSPKLKMPRYTSFTINTVNEDRWCKSDSDGTCLSSPWRSDVRLGAEQTATCSTFDTVAPYNISHNPLFPSVFSQDNLVELVYLVSNTLPFSNQLKARWQELTDLTVKWQRLYGPLTVVAGPVFDYDADSLADDINTISSGGGVLVPSHLFLVVTRCAVYVSQPHLCPHEHLDALAFVYPQHLPVQNCLDSTRFSQEFSARVGDVEDITGLRFFPRLSHQDRVRLLVRVHSNVWGRETWPNRLRNNFIHQEI